MGKRWLRIQEGQCLKSALNLVLIGQNARSRCADFAGILIIEKADVHLKCQKCQKIQKC